MTSHIPLHGSHSQHPSGSTFVAKPDANEIIQVTLILRRRNEAPHPAQLHRHLTHTELAELHGADPADILAVEAFAAEHHLSIARIHPASRTVVLTGPLGQLAELFGADLEVRQVGDKKFRTRQGLLHLPRPLDGRVMAIFGFDQRPTASTDRRLRPRASQSVAYTPPQEIGRAHV